MSIFRWIYFLAIVIEMVIRAPLNKKRKQEKMSERRISTQEKSILGLLFLAMFLLPLIYVTTDWLSFADYKLPGWAGWIGVVFMAGALFVFWRAHADLGLNWSPSLEIREKHELITRGIYGVIRHPMYASQWLWVIAQPLLLQNWIVGFGDLIVFALFYFLRVRSEEQLMIDSFGDQYRDYMKRVGGVIPKFSKS
jgi:protein-S-isoprenylcysteine O-methyltransferase Ste14